MTESAPTAQITAWFTRPGEADAEPRPVTLELRGHWVWMRGGPTGWESLHIAAARSSADGRGWTANVGDRRYSNCFVPPEEMATALAVLEPAGAAR